MKKMTKIGMFFAVFTLAVVLFQTTASAHGYISKPASRVYLANKGINVGVGSAQYEPQSVEAPKGFPISGPADGVLQGRQIFAVRRAICKSLGKSRYRIWPINCRMDVDCATQNKQLAIFYY